MCIFSNKLFNSQSSTYFDFEQKYTMYVFIRGQTFFDQSASEANSRICVNFLSLNLISFVLSAPFVCFFIISEIHRELDENTQKMALKRINMLFNHSFFYQYFSSTELTFFTVFRRDLNKFSLFCAEHPTCPNKIKSMHIKGVQIACILKVSK